MSLQVFFDGSYGPRYPHGTAAYGFVVKREGEVIHEDFGRCGSGPGYTSNVGEYQGLCEGMWYVHNNYPEEPTTFFGDSTLVINQMNGVAKAKKGAYLPYYYRAIEAAADYIAKGLWKFEWIPRALNSEADKLAQYQRSRRN